MRLTLLFNVEFSSGSFDDLCVTDGLGTATATFSELRGFFVPISGANMVLLRCTRF